MSKSKRKRRRPQHKDPMPREKALGYLSALTGEPKEELDEDPGFGWWGRIPYPVQGHPDSLIQFEVMPDEEFWGIVDIINWEKSAKSGISKKAESFLSDLSNEKKIALANAFAFRFQMLYMTMDCYVMATYDSPQTSDDGTSDLLSEVIGRGEAFFLDCMASPDIVSKMGQESKYTESFMYALPDPESDRSDRPRYRTSQMAEDGSHPSYSPWLVRYFQLIYGTI